MKKEAVQTDDRTGELGQFRSRLYCRTEARVFHLTTYEEAHPIKGFSHRAEPCRMSKSTRHTLVPALPDELAVLVGRKIRTVRWWSSSVGIMMRWRGNLC